MLDMTPFQSQPPPPGVYGLGTAYTPVSVRQSFAPGAAMYPPPPVTYAGYGAYPYSTAPPTNLTPAPAPPQPKQEDPSDKKIDWPDSVRRYVQRSFDEANMDPTISRPELEKKLKETIIDANNRGTMHTLDWDNYPLPQQLIRQERERTYMLAAMAAAQTAHTAHTAHTAQPAAQEAVPQESIQRPKEGGPKKRKSADISENDQQSAAPWQAANGNGSSLENRITRPSVEASTADDQLQKSSKLQKQLEKRQRRFDGGYKSTYRSPSPAAPAGPVVGTCQTLEKRYLRLTSAPIPSQVRPEYILRQTLDLLKKKWKREGNYSYICDQFKSMRQDLTVQRIKNDFTVSVYEIHARIALEKGDLGEYNQCQTQLRALYALGLKGNPIEFKAYRILYFIHTANRSALNDALADLTAAEKEEKPIKHALDVRSSLALGNYHRFFQLYLDTPNMGAYLMDMFVTRERLAALANICKAYKPDVRLRFVTEELGFESDADAAQFIIDYQGQHLLEERDDQIAFLTGKAGQLFEEARKIAFQKVDIKGQI